MTVGTWSCSSDSCHLVCHQNEQEPSLRLVVHCECDVSFSPFDLSLSPSGALMSNFRFEAVAMLKVNQIGLMPIVNITLTRVSRRWTDLPVKMWPNQAGQLYLVKSVNRWHHHHYHGANGHAPVVTPSVGVKYI